jgi:hypothetical protein
MSTSLKTSGVLPTTSPYAEDPRTVAGIPATVTDWVLVQLRSTAGGTAVASRSALLRKDGRIVADDGIKTEIAVPAPPGGYYIVIKHRNHLPVMSASLVTLSPTSSMLYDFTTGQIQGYGTNAMKQAGSVSVMYGGNADGNGGVGASDLVNVRDAVGIMMYNVNDADMNGGVGASDLVLVRLNVGQVGQVP